MSDRTKTLQVRTPEGVLFSLLLAGPVVRAVAWLSDFFCVLTLMKFAEAIMGALGLISVDFSQALTGLLYFFIQIGYGILLEWLWRGQTIGKRLFRLRVVDEQGLRLQFNQIAIRNLLRFVDSLPLFYLVGGITSLLTQHAQRLGDIAANTIVIRDPKTVAPNIANLLAGKFNSFRNYPHLEARLRQRVAVNEANVALRALLRRDQFDDSARIELFSEIATYFKGVVEFPPEATEGITDEQYMRNVVDILFNTRTSK